jgi:hypothetical protein
MTIRRIVKYYWVRLTRLRGDPRKLAWGMALGVFIGVTPTIPFHNIMALTLAPLFRVSVVTAFIGIYICNPLTIPPLYFAAYEVGRLLVFRDEVLSLPETFDMNSLMDLLWRGGLALQVGGLIIAIPPAIASYFLTLWAVKRYRQQKAQRFKGVRHQFS